MDIIRFSINLSRDQSVVVQGRHSVHGVWHISKDFRQKSHQRRPDARSSDENSRRLFKCPKGSRLSVFPATKRFFLQKPPKNRMSSPKPPNSLKQKEIELAF
jgi:hypothetical protein